MLIPGLLAAAWLADSLTLQSSTVDITPSEPLPMGGYSERGSKLSEPGGDHLYARAEVFRQGSTELALVSCEMLTIPGSLYREVLKRLRPGTKLFLSATHTHCAPDSQMLNDRMTFSIPGIASFKPRWLTWYADKIASAVDLAERSRAKTLHQVLGEEVQVKLNRGRREGAVPDQTATEVTADEEPLLFSYAAHPVFFGPERMQLSGDWAGVLAQDLKCPVLPGAIGDVSPHADGPTPVARIARFADSMTKALSRCSGRTLLWQPGAAFDEVQSPISLDPVKANPIAAAYYHVPTIFADGVASQFAPRSASITAFRLGKLAVVGIPGEPMSHLGRAIKAYGLSLGFREVLVVSHVNGWMGYILMREDYDRGGYEATLSFYGRKEGEKVVQAADEALRRLAHAPAMKAGQQ